jgi:integrase
LPTGTKILWVFQTKLIALPPADRWKPIPLVYDEQKFALRVIESQTFQKPLVKTVRKYCGPGIGFYGGRKGFTDLMLSKGHSLESISQRMGHSTIARTWRTYKDRRGVAFSL